MRAKSIRTMMAICATGFTLLMSIEMNGCKAGQKLTAKTGAQLWVENCRRCHNNPSPSTFSPEQWETIGMHMQTRALITEDEKNKIVAFLKQ